MKNDQICDAVKGIIKQVDSATDDDLIKIQLLKTAADQIQHSVNTAHLRQTMYNLLRGK